MKLKANLVFISISILFLIGLTAFNLYENSDEDKFISYTADPAKQDIQLYWKDDSGQILKSIQNLKTFVDSKHATLTFAMNAGMYQADNKPLGLFIQYGKTLSSLNTRSGGGNFYLKPNGIFYITTDNKAAARQTDVLSHTENIKFATQSGPMLVIVGKIHAAFVEGSSNLTIRNGVGILPDCKIFFAMSKNFCLTT